MGERKGTDVNGVNEDIEVENMLCGVSERGYAMYVGGRQRRVKGLRN